MGSVLSFRTADEIARGKITAQLRVGFPSLGGSAERGARARIEVRRLEFHRRALGRQVRKVPVHLAHELLVASGISVFPVFEAVRSCGNRRQGDSGKG